MKLVKNGEIRTLSPGDLVRHFKHEMDLESESDRYLYKVIDFAIDTETGETVVIYRSIATLQLYVRPLDMFLSEVDHEKYPHVSQIYRFEKVGN